MDDLKLSWPAPDRNKEPILEVLERHLPQSGLVLEIASGSGQHAVHFAPNFPGVVWQPSDPELEHRQSITAWREHANIANMSDPLDLDTTHDAWQVEEAAAIICINMIHISPWQSSQGLFRGAADLLPPSAPVILYGPFMIEGRHTSASNAQFSENLQRRDPEWGVRDLADVTSLARENGFDFDEKIEMPANNLSVIFRKT